MYTLYLSPLVFLHPYFFVYRGGMFSGEGKKLEVKDFWFRDRKGLTPGFLFCQAIANILCEWGR